MQIGPFEKCEERSKRERRCVVLKRVVLIVLGLLVSTSLSIAQWGTPTNIHPVNTASDEVRPAISSNGNTLYLSSDRSGGQGFYDIWESTNVGGVWQMPTNPGPPLNSIHMDWLPSISASGNTMYFLSDQPGGVGGMDIWVSIYSGGAWGTPVNLTAVNSMYTE
jgi:hypothetical protein